MSAPATKTAAFVESTHLLMALHRLFLEQKDESSEADELRDTMEAPWYAMTEEEQRRIRQLSADLYTIGDRTLAAPPPGPEPSAALGRALDAGDWDAVLALLQEHPGLAPPAERAHLRAMAWAGLAVPIAAVAFHEDALRASALAAPAPVVSPSHTTSKPSPGRIFPRLGRVEREAA
jgi:hypothetical protein